MPLIDIKFPLKLFPSGRNGYITFNFPFLKNKACVSLGTITHFLDWVSTAFTDKTIHDRGGHFTLVSQGWLRHGGLCVSKQDQHSFAFWFIRLRNPFLDLCPSTTDPCLSKSTGNDRETRLRHLSRARLTHQA